MECEQDGDICEMGWEGRRPVFARKPRGRAERAILEAVFKSYWIFLSVGGGKSSCVKLK